jgi:hypothetical protein
MTQTAGTAPSRKMEFVPYGASGPDTSKKVTAQYNPNQLQYTITNTAARGSGTQRVQKVDESSAKLTVELVFDTTHNGDDVRTLTEKVAQLMKPDAKSKVPPKVDVSWGAFKFTGIFDSYKETIDYFSEDGVPLRATVSVSLSSPADKNKVPLMLFHFSGGATSAAIAETNRVGSPDERAVESPTRSGQSMNDVAAAGGDPSRDHELAAENGIEDIRDPSEETDTLVVPEDEPELLDAVAFASAGAAAGASAGASAGFSAGASAGFSAGASAGFSAGASAGFSAGASAGFSAGASAGFSAGASAGFSAGASAGFSAGAGAGFSAGAGAGFSAGAGAEFSAGAGAGFSADAGTGFTAGAFAGASGGAFAGASGFAGASASGGAFAQASFTADAGGSWSSGPLAGSAASAGVSASEGAFALLRAPSSPPRRPFDAGLLVTRSETTSTTVSETTTYAVGGKAVGATATYRTEVGQSSSFHSKIIFEED